MMKNAEHYAKNTELYKRIHEIAKQLAKEKQTFTRADLASELRRFGINRDSNEVGRLIMDAYEFFGNDPKIKDAFVNNDEGRSVVEDMLVGQMLDEGDEEGVFSQLSDELAEGEKSLQQLSRLRSKVSKGVTAQGKSNALDVIVGTRGLKNVKAEAEAYFDLYSKFVNAYTVARDDVKNVISDFVEVRGHVAEIYREYAMKLVDVFGDSIKAVAPVLFDFDSVQYMNVDEMYKTVKLAYGKLMDKCVMLIGETSDNFVSALTASVGAAGAMQKQGNIFMGLILAGVNMFDHYSSATEREIEARGELEGFKQDITHDLYNMAADYTRLESVFTILNDNYIIRAQSFYKYADKVLSKELQELFDSLYKNDAVREPAQKRETILEECKALERDVADSNVNIEYYKESIATGEELLRYKSEEYETARNEMPIKPFFLVNWLTFGSAMKKYRRHYYDWKEYRRPVIDEYDRCRAEIVMDRKELASHQANLKEANSKLRAKKEELKRVNREIADRIRVSDEIKLRMCGHLGSIVNLLRIAKDIAESGLDEAHVNVVTLDRAGAVDLPEEMGNRIDNFTQKLKEVLIVPAEVVEVPEQQGKGAFVQGDAVGQQQDGGQPYSEGRQDVSGQPADEDALLLAAQNKLVERSVDVLNKWAKLKAMEAQGQTAREEYARQFREIRAQFGKVMKDTNNKTEVLLEAVKRMNLSQTDEELRDALLSLGGEGGILSKQDIDDLLSGIKTIEI